MMSIRGIHFVFILASIVLSGMVALWSFNMYLVSDTSLGYLVFSCGSLTTGCGMAAYLVLFVRKSRQIGME